MIALLLLAGCGTASNDAASTAEADAPGGEVASDEVDLNGVSLDVRRDPG